MQLGFRCFRESKLCCWFFNKKANVSAVRRRQQQHWSQESLQTEFADCIYDTGLNNAGISLLHSQEMEVRSAEFFHD